MARLNEQHLRHSGPTDVITFDYRDPAQPRWLAGDIFVCVPVAVEQSTTFHVSWQQELVRYVVHGILHLLGHDDQSAAKRAVMKKAENRLVRTLGRRFRLARIDGHP
jgi:probable rRNA maturation factor